MYLWGRGTNEIVAVKPTDVFRKTGRGANRDLQIALPVPLSVNLMYRNRRGGGRALTKKALDYIRDSRALINLAIEEQKWKMPDKHAWLYVDMVYYFPDRKIRDSHNCLKILLDVMQGIVYENDYWVLPRIQSVEYDKENPRVELRVFMQDNTSRKKGVQASRVML